MESLSAREGWAESTVDKHCPSRQIVHTAKQKNMAYILFVRFVRKEQQRIMNEYISTFTTGFSEVIRRALTSSLPGCSIIAVYDGLIYYHYSGNPSDICAISYLNNSFHVIKKFQGDSLNFPCMAREITRKPLRPALRKGSFRVRFSRENRFEKVDDQIVSNVERAICRNCGMTVDRVNPQQEFWFIIRRENVGFFCQLLLKRQHTEKNLKKGRVAT